MKVGLIGLGLMGNPMAKNILKKGFPLAVYNRTLSKTTEFKKLGAEVSKSPKELVQKADVVITMVTGPGDVEEVLLGENGVVKSARKGLIIIDMSTIGPTAAQKIAEKLKKYHQEFLDAPVTGSVLKAKSGELTIFIGGKKKIFEKAKPVLLTMGNDLHYLGPVGSGQAVKLINNHLVAATLAALAEGILLADILKIPRAKLAEALNNVFAVSPLMRLKLPNMVENKFPTAFSMANMHKDEKLSLEEVKRAKKALPLLALVEKLYQKGLQMGLSQRDNSAILEVFSKIG